MARMRRGHPSVLDSWSTRESLDAVPPLKDSMPQDAFKDIHRCMHFSDDWDDDGDCEWDEVYSDERFNASPNVEHHRRKFEHIEDAFNKRWKAIVNFGRWITADESRVAGWYKSGITIGPEPKPIRTGATIHSMCVTFGALATYKLHCRVYGGKHDEGLNHVGNNTATMQKWVNLYDEMFDAFKGLGMCCTMDSAYMSDTIAQIARDEWLFNLVGTCQSSRTGADDAEIKKAMKVGTYECVMFQHRMLNLCFSLWADNNIVKTLSNFHSPTILKVGEGVLRRRRVDGKREQVRTKVQTTAQHKVYSETFHLIDKGNGKEGKYDMGGHTKGHNWAPKLSMRFWNFGMGNAHTIYSALHDKHTPNRRKLCMGECVNILAHSLMQAGEPMRSYSAEHPQTSRHLGGLWDWGAGRRIRSDCQWTVARGTRGPRFVSHEARGGGDLRKKRKKAKWRVHQSFAHSKKGRCCFVNCPGRKKSKAKVKRSYDTYMRCEECSVAAGKDIYLCNNVKSGTPVLCHLAHHQMYHTKAYKDNY